MLRRAASFVSLTLTLLSLSCLPAFSRSSRSRSHSPPLAADNQPGFDWQNPFTAYNCTWGFHSPTPFPVVDQAALACGSRTGYSGVELHERGNSTTCPRQMLCDYNTLPDGRITKPITWCNIEGYNGMKQEWLPTTRAMLAKMPNGRCPYPPGDRPGMIGFNSAGHYVGGPGTGAPGRCGQIEGACFS